LCDIVRIRFFETFLLRNITTKSAHPFYSVTTTLTLYDTKNIYARVFDFRKFTINTALRNNASPVFIVKSIYIPFYYPQWKYIPSHFAEKYPHEICTPFLFCFQYINDKKLQEYFTV
jgi:hypothetical protein